MAIQVMVGIACALDADHRDAGGKGISRLDGECFPHAQRSQRLKICPGTRRVIRGAAIEERAECKNC